MCPKTGWLYNSIHLLYNSSNRRVGMSDFFWYVNYQSVELLTVLRVKKEKV